MRNVAINGSLRVKSAGRGHDLNERPLPGTASSTVYSGDGREAAGRREVADVVEKVRWWERQTSRRGTAGRCRGSGWHGVHGEWNKLGELAEVLGCSGEVELVTGAVRPA